MTTDRTILPFVKGSDTSRAAAEKVYDYIVSRGDYGATDDEIAVSLELRHQTASPRRRGLVIMGAVYATEERRPTRSGQTATVWRAVPGLDVRKPQGRPPKGEGGVSHPRPEPESEAAGERDRENQGRDGPETHRGGVSKICRGDGRPTRRVVIE